jgi:hypothetical protein
MNKPVEIVVGRGGTFDPIAGTTICSMPLYAGQSLWLEKTGYGTYDYNKWAELSGGGFRLTDTQFVDGERFYVHFTGISYGTDETSYTNGFNRSAIMSALYGRVGWREANPDSPVLSNINTLSKGGRHYQDFHTLVTVDNVRSVMENATATDDQFNSYLETIQRSAILRSVNGLFKGCFASEPISQKVLFRRTWQPNDVPVENKGQFVYLALRLPPKENLGVQVDQIALYFDSDVTFNLYLFHDTKKAPLSVVEVSAVADTQTLVSLPDMVLNYLSANAMGGTFYVGYFQDDLNGAKAYYESRECSFSDVYFWTFGEADKTPGEYNFNRRNVRMNNVNYGMNFHISTFRDHTQEIVKKATLFDDVIGLTMAANIVEQVVYSTRSNGTERILKEAIGEFGAQMDLNGTVPVSNVGYIPSLKKRISEEYKQLQRAFFPPGKSKTVNNVEYDC